MKNLLPFNTTLSGSFPYIESQALCRRLAVEIELPAWPQLPRRTFLENMYTQYSTPLPGITIDYQREEVFAAIHNDGALAGVHCCGNTDWSVLLETSVDVLNLDAYDYLESLALFPQELRCFLDRGGWICWGLIPNNPMVFQETAPSLANRLDKGFAMIVEKAHRRDVIFNVSDLAQRSLLAPSCGLGSVSLEIADRALLLLTETADLLRHTS